MYQFHAVRRQENSSFGFSTLALRFGKNQMFCLWVGFFQLAGNGKLYE